MKLEYVLFGNKKKTVSVINFNTFTNKNINPASWQLDKRNKTAKSDLFLVKSSLVYI